MLSKSCPPEDFLAVKPGCGLSREKKHGGGECGGMGAHKTSKRGKESGSEGCMCLMSVFPRWLEIIIWSKKPWVSHLHGDAVTLSRAANVSKHWGLLRPPVVLLRSTVFMVEL